MQITYSGSEPGDGSFLSRAFFDFSGTLNNLSLISSSDTEVILENTETGLITTIRGTGLVVVDTQNTAVIPLLGTMTSLTMDRVGANSGTFETIGHISDISWDIAQFWSALQALESSLDFTQIAALYNSSGPITVDGTGAAPGFGMYDFFDFAPPGQNLSEYITQPMTILGSSGSDDLSGGLGNDSIDPGSSDDFDEIVYSPGNDTIDFSAADGISGGYGLLYYRAPGFTATLNSQTNTGSISYGNFTDTLVNVTGALSDQSGFGGMFLFGGDESDTFNITLDGSSGFQWLGLRGRGGDDDYDITFNGNATLFYDLRFGSGGVYANLSTGIIYDGHGDIDTLTVRGTGGRIELQGSAFTDHLIGSARDELFATERGNDRVDGGGGWDVLRYDRNGADAVDVDLQAGTATGTWFGEAFTDTISNIEEVIGSREGNDSIAGSGTNERFEGQGGDDTLDGAGGSDSLFGEDGNDLINGEDGDDLINGGNGRDVLIGDIGNDTLNGGEGQDSLNGGLYADVLNGGAGHDDIRGNRGNDTIDGGRGDDIARGGAKNDSMLGGLGNDTLYGQTGQDTLKGGAGNDTLGGGDGDDLIFGDDGADDLNGNAGNDTLIGGDDNDTLEGKSGDDEIRGGSGNDRAKGGADNDALQGEEGNDLLFGNLGNDLIDGGAGADTLIGGDGNDALEGGLGADELRGGTGTDVFVFDIGHGEDTIGDLEIGVDVIEISGALAAGRDEAALVALGNVVNGDYRIDLGGGDVLVLEGIASDTGLETMLSVV